MHFSVQYVFFVFTYVVILIYQNHHLSLVFIGNNLKRLIAELYLCRKIRQRNLILPINAVCLRDTLPLGPLFSGSFFHTIHRQYTYAC